MGVLDKFLDIMKLNDDYEDDDDYLDDFDDDFEDDYNQKKSKKPKFLNKNNKYDDDFGYDDAPSSKSSTSNRFSQSNKVTPIRNNSTSSSKTSSGMGVCVIKPTSIDDGREICETLLDSRTVILNLEGLDLEIAQRIIDFTSGAAYAMKGNLQKISNYIFLVTPVNVDISGDLQDLLGNSFDVSSIRARF
ncbi:MAG: cell division protein SepF [Eubacteriales bacterium]